MSTRRASRRWWSWRTSSRLIFERRRRRCAANWSERYNHGRRQLLAEKIETQEELAEAARLGFVLFQGYYFGKPEMLTTEKVPVLVDTHLRIQRALSLPALDLIAIEQLIKSEPALCYRLLRYLQSPGFYLQTEIMSILHALALLGENELRKWLMLMASVVAAGGEPNPEPIARALARARFAELLAPFVALPASSLYLTSLFAQMERLVNRPLATIVDEVVLPEEVRQALAGEATPLRHCQELVAAYDRGDWRKSDSLRQRFQIPEIELRAMRREAAVWASRMTNCDLALKDQMSMASQAAHAGSAPIIMLHR